MALNRLTIDQDSLDYIYEYTQTQLGGASVTVDASPEEIKVLLTKAYQTYTRYLNDWKTENVFPNVYGTSASRDFTYHYVTANTNLSQQFSDWLASLSRVGGKLPWRKDYIKLEAGRQIYNLATESSKPYMSGKRRINKILWYAQPETHVANFTSQVNGGQGAGYGYGGMGGNQNVGNSGGIYGPSADGLVNEPVIQSTPQGLQHNNSPLYFVGYLYDTILLRQSMSMANKVLFSSFHHNISGDILEISPMPGVSVNIPQDAKLFYYYFDEDDMLNFPNQDPNDPLIISPDQIKLNGLHWEQLNQSAQEWIMDYAYALVCKMIANKLRRIKKIASPESTYEVEFDYAKLDEDGEAKMEELKTYLKEKLEKLTYKQLLADQAENFNNAKVVNNARPRLMTWG